MLHNKNIVLGVTGGIAAYKIPILVRAFIKEGAHVKVVMSKDATRFVTAETLGVLSKHEVVSDFFDADHNWNNHVKLAEWADIMVIAPLTANTLAKMANGICDNVLMATFLSARCKVFAAPAMDFEMYQHPTTKQNLDKVKANGVVVIPAETGELASGLSGEGRMAEPENILQFINKYYKDTLPLTGKKVMVNAGPTYEAIDPVRFIGNRSSGKMGIAIADRFAALGADVTLVLGPTPHCPTNKLVHCIPVESAEQMYEASVNAAKDADIVVCSAAVADYKIKNVSAQKIKKSTDEFSIDLIKTTDILSELGKQKRASQLLVGFALETNDLEAYAKEKLVKKNLDMIVANNATNAGGSVFGSSMNQVSVIDKNNNLTKFELLSKEETAVNIVNAILQLLALKK